MADAKNKPNNVKNKNFKMAIVFCAIFVFFNFIGNSNGGKSKKMAKQKPQKSDPLAGSSDSSTTIDKNRQCPEKDETSPNTEDLDEIQLVTDFKKFLSEKNSADFEERFQENSLIWHFTQKIFKLLSADTSKFDGNSCNELEAKLAYFRMKWEEIKAFQQTEDRTFVICILYQFASKIIKETATFATEISDWSKVINESRLIEHITMDDEVNCESPPHAKGIYTELMSETSMGIILGSNLADLLELSLTFRHFFCHEIEMSKMKLELNKHIEANEMSILENEFPEIIRIDLTITPILFVRCQALLTNHSNSEQFKVTLMQWTIGQLIEALIRSSNELMTEQLNFSVDALRGRIRSLNTTAYRNLRSEQHLCALIKMLQFAESISPKNAHKINEKAVKRWRGLEECAVAVERQRTVDQFRRSDTQADKFEQSLQKVMKYKPERFREILLVPGSKTRLALLMGSRERFDKLIGNEGLLKNVYTEDVFTDDIRLCSHYKLSFDPDQSEDKAWAKCCKIGTDLIVFMRWFKRKLDKVNQLTFWIKIYNFVADELYDAMFDKEEAELDKWEQILMEIFAGTKNFVKKNLKKGVKNFYKKWKETVVDEAMKSHKKRENVLKIGEWMEKMHQREFKALLANGHFNSEFRKIILSQNAVITNELMQKFFTEKTIADLCDEISRGDSSVLFVGESSKSAEKCHNYQSEAKDEAKDEAERAAGDESDHQWQQQMSNKQIEQILKEMLFKGGTESAEECQNGNGTLNLDERTALAQCHFPCPSTEEVQGQQNSLIENATIEKEGKTLLSAYLCYLNNSSRTDDTYAMEGGKPILFIELQGVLWLLMLMCERLVIIATSLALALPAASEFRAEAQLMSQRWDELLAFVDALSLAEHKLFVAYKFARFLCDNETMRNSSDQWVEHLGNEPFVRILFKVNGTEDLAQEWTMLPIYDHLEAVRIFESLTADEENKMINLLCVSALIEKLKAFRWYFCKMNPVQLENNKTRLSKLIGENLLVRLDELFPEVLQIDVPVSLVQSVLYKTFLSLPSDSERSLLIGCRLIVPLLLRRAKDVLGTIPNTIAPNIFKAFQFKFRCVQLAIFLVLRNAKANTLLTAVCMLHNFTQFMLKSGQLIQIVRGTIKEQTIRNWSDQKCERDVEERLRAYKQQVADLSTYHYDDLKRIVETNIGKFSEFMKSTRGARTRAAKLLTEKHKDLLRIYHYRLTNRQMFDDSNMMQNYLDAIFDIDTTTRIVGNLSAQLSVWVRWMDSELSEEQNANRTIGLRKFYEHVWSMARLQFEEMFDELEDNNLGELEQQSYLLKELLPRAKELVEVKRTERNLDKLDIHRESSSSKRQQKREKPEKHPLMAEWAQMMDKVRGEASKMALSEEETEQERWTKRRHLDTLITLLAANRHFRQQLQKGLDQNNEAKERLLNFIQLEKIDQFVCLLNATNEEEFETKVKQLKGEIVSREYKTGEEEKKQQNEAKTMADQNMKKLIREEERLKEKMAQRQVEKQKRRRESEQKRKTERDRRRESKNSDESTEEMLSALMPFSAGMPLGRYSEEDFGDSPCRYGESPSPSPSRCLDSPSRYGNSPSQSPSRHCESPSKYFASPSRYAIKSPGGTPSKWQKKMLEKELINELANLQLSDFASDEFLHLLYAQFLTNPSERKRRILDIGVFVNEISHRMETVAKFNKILELKGEEMLLPFEYGQRMDELKCFLKAFFEENKNAILELKTEGEFEEFVGILHQMLKRTIFELEGQKNDGEKMEENELENNKNNNNSLALFDEEMKMVRKQLHRNKLAKAIANCDEQNELAKVNAKSIWEALEESGQNNVLMKLLVTTKSNLAERFKEHLQGWHTLAAQRQIDRNLYEQFEDKFMEKNDSKLETNFPENSQQIYFKSTDDSVHEQFLVSILNENGFYEAQSTGSALKALKLIISEWSDGTARLLETGSYLLGAHTSNADIDTICIMRQRLATQTEEMNAFFSNYYCNLSQRICEDNSLYCLLCKHPFVDFLNKAPRAYMPMLEVRFSGIEFDVSFVLISDIESIPDEPLDAIDVKWMMNILALSPEPRRDAMLKSLSGYLANHRILELMRNKGNLKKFKTLLWSLKFWAKSNYVYGGIFGLFNGAALSILTAKMILWYPNCSVPFLFEKMMLILTNWNWPMPIQLTEQSTKSKFQSISWNAFDESMPLIMPIITPGNLMQNASQNINKSAFSIIQNAMRETFAQLRIFRNLAINSFADEQNWWKKLFPVKEFINKYDHFVVIVCMVNVAQNVNQFCRFVERKMRFQLEKFDAIFDQFIEYSHVNPNSHFANETKCPETMATNANANSQFHFCKQWLVGLKLKELGNDGEKGQKVKLGEGTQKLLNETVKMEVDSKICREYALNVLRGWYQHVTIESRYVEANELAQFGYFKQNEEDDGTVSEKIDH